jgi:hypothetical protein
MAPVGGAGGAHMETEATGRAMDSLQTAGEHFGGVWASTYPRIRALEGQLGGGLLGEAFMQRYAVLAQMTANDDMCSPTGGTEQTEDTFRGFAEAGRASIRDYEQADRDGEAAMPE